MRLALCAVALLGLPLASVAQMQLILTGGRSAFQTNETIDLALVRQDAAALPAEDLTFQLAGGDSLLIAQFALVAVPARAGGARDVHHYRLNAALLRPASYTITALARSGRAATEAEVYSHIRRSTFRLIDWAGGRSRTTK
jgi:hypothetical protein